jgi:UDP-glucose 4-epimerase
MSYYARKFVLVTGGLGFMGSNLVLALVGAGARVRIIDHSWPRGDELPVDSGSVEYVKADIRDADAVAEAMRGCSVVFNLAARSGSASSNSSPLDDLDVNARGHLTLLEGAREVAPGAKIVFASSRLVYTPALQLPVCESAPTTPISIYGIHKLAAEHYHLLYQRMYGLRATVLRITNPYGPHQRLEQNRYGIVNWLILQAVRGLDLTVYGDGGQLRDYVHVDDVVRAFMVAGEHEAADGKVFNVGSGRPVSFKEMADLVVAQAQSGSVRLIDWPEAAAQVETGDFCADITLIDQSLGWRPVIGLEAGIADTIRNYRSLASLS